MRKVSDCIVTEINNSVCREEQGKVICFINEEYNLVVEIASIDNCVLKNEKSCDFLFLLHKEKQEYKSLVKNSTAFYVELKGNHLVNACEQLLNSIEKTKDEIEGFDINAIVVSSREYVPRFHNNEYRRNIERLIKKEMQFKLTPYTQNI